MQDARPSMSKQNSAGIGSRFQAGPPQVAYPNLVRYWQPGSKLLRRYIDKFDLHAVDLAKNQFEFQGS